MITGTLKLLRQQLLDLAFPPSCQLCREWFSAQDSTERAYCGDCAPKLTQTIPHSCLRCAASIGPYSDSKSGCIHCRDYTLHFDGVVCLGMYDRHLRHAILAAKSSFSDVAITSLTNLLWQRHCEQLRQFEVDLILPIPQSWPARIGRRFNQAARVGETLSGALDCPLDRHILCRSRNSRPQKRVAAKERHANQRDSFRLQDAHVVNGMNVLLTDDVLTTGATCSEAARTLKAAGAKSVHVAVLARVLSSRN